MDRIDEAISNQLNRRTTVDYLLLADRADVVNGKLYMMGGAWDRLQPPTFPYQMMLGIALGIRVPYAESEDSHEIRVVLENADGERLFEIEAQLQTGRPPGLRGSDLTMPMAFNMPIQFTAPGEFALHASVDGTEGRRQSIKAEQRGFVG